MVDRTWNRIATWLVGYKKAYEEAAQANNEDEMEIITDRLDSFIKGLTYGLSRHYVKKIWKSVGMDEDFEWDAHIEPYIYIAREASSDGADNQ